MTVLEAAALDRGEQHGDPAAGPRPHEHPPQRRRIGEVHVREALVVLGIVVPEGDEHEVSRPQLLERAVQVPLGQEAHRAAARDGPVQHLEAAGRVEPHPPPLPRGVLGRVLARRRVGEHDRSRRPARGGGGDVEPGRGIGSGGQLRAAAGAAAPVVAVLGQAGVLPGEAAHGAPRLGRDMRADGAGAHDPLADRIGLPARMPGPAQAHAARRDIVRRRQLCPVHEDPARVLAGRRRGEQVPGADAADLPALDQGGRAAVEEVHVSHDEAVAQVDAPHRGPAGSIQQHRVLLAQQVAALHEDAVATGAQRDRLGVGPVGVEPLVEGVRDGQIAQGDLVGVDGERRAVLHVRHACAVPRPLVEAEHDPHVLGTAGRGADQQRRRPRRDHDLLHVLAGLDHDLAHRRIRERQRQRGQRPGPSADADRTDGISRRGGRGGIDGHGAPSHELTRDDARLQGWRTAGARGDGDQGSGAAGPSAAVIAASRSGTSSLITGWSNTAVRTTTSRCSPRSRRRGASQARLVPTPR